MSEPKVLIAPGKYIQGPKALNSLYKHLEKLDIKKPLILGGPTSLKITKPLIQASWEENTKKTENNKTPISDPLYLTFNRECCQEEIDRVIEIVKENKNDSIIGIGGGKCLDTAKVCCNECNLPVIIIPTICATDAPTSALSVIYTKTGEFSKYVFLKSNPNIVLVDTEIIAQAPVRFLISGMGDALATFFEAEQCFKTNRTNCAGGKPSKTSLALAKLCYETLIESGELAIASCINKVTSPAFEDICEANTLLSGLGFESCGLAAAHAVHNGLTSIKETHKYYHGEKVAIGTLTQLVMQNASKQLIHEVFTFCKNVNLPFTLKHIGIDEKDKKFREKLMKAAELAAVETETIHNMPFKVTKEQVFSALLTVNEIGKSYLMSY